MPNSGEKPAKNLESAPQTGSEPNSVFGSLWRSGSGRIDARGGSSIWTIPEFLKRFRELSEEDPPSIDTINNWIIGSTEPQKRFRIGIVRVFFGETHCLCDVCKICALRMSLQRSWGEQSVPSSVKQRKWRGTRYEASFPNDDALVQLTIHDVYGDEPDLIVSLGYGRQAGKLSVQDSETTIRFTIEPVRLEIRHKLESAQFVEGTILNTQNVSYGLYWEIDGKDQNDKFPLNGDRLAKIKVTGSDPKVSLNVLCQYNDFKVNILDDIPNKSEKNLRILERILQIWGVHPEDVYASLGSASITEDNDK
jgi:hypothetical protein